MQCFPDCVDYERCLERGILDSPQFRGLCANYSSADDPPRPNEREKYELLREFWETLPENRRAHLGFYLCEGEGSLDLASYEAWSAWFARVAIQGITPVKGFTKLKELGELLGFTINRPEQPIDGRFQSLGRQNILQGSIPPKSLAQRPAQK